MTERGASSLQNRSTSVDSMSAPVDVLWDRGRNELRIMWDDGASSELDIAYLRRWCPCAACQGHSGRVAFLAAVADTQAREIEEVGAYALRITFADGHDSGIFSWTWLRRLDPAAPPTGLKSGVFSRGSFRRAID